MLHQELKEDSEAFTTSIRMLFVALHEVAITGKGRAYLHCELACGSEDEGVGGRHALVPVQETLQQRQGESCCLAGAYSTHLSSQCLANHTHRALQCSCLQTAFNAPHHMLTTLYLYTGVIVHTAC